MNGKSMNNIILCQESNDEEILIAFALLGVNGIFFVLLMILFESIIEWFFAFIGIQFFIFAIMKLILLNNLKKWIPVSIQILESNILMKQTYSESSHKHCFQPVVKYQFIVDGNTYSSQTLSIDIKSITTFTEDDTKKILSKIQENKTAFYNPLNPKKSVIFKNIANERKSHYYGLMTVGLILIMATLWLVCL